MFTRITFSLGILAMLAGISCDRVPLLAPTNSSVTLDAGTRVLETGASTTLSAMVIESSGTPVQNGTTVRFTTTLGRVDPAEAQTRNGVATTTFFAGDASGVAEVRATSGGGGSTTPTTPPANGDNGGTTTTPSTPTNSNVVLISVGAGAVDTVTVRANPSSVSTSSGATVNLIATVVGTGGRLLGNIPVSFSATRGTLSATTALSDAQGEARVTLNTNGDTDITVAAGTKTATTKITGVPGPAVSLTCAIGTNGSCANATVGSPVTFTARRAEGSGNLASAALDFGDNSSVDLGNLASPSTIPHTYAQAGTYTARLTGIAANGESSTTVQVVIVGSATSSVSATISTAPRTVTATATVSGSVTQYQFDWGDGNNTTGSSASATHSYAAAGTYTITVTASLASGGTATASTSITVP